MPYGISQVQPGGATNVEDDALTEYQPVVDLSELLDIATPNGEVT